MRCKNGYFCSVNQQSLAMEDKELQPLIDNYHRKIAKISLDFKRYLFSQINWDARMIGIKGARGVGKTTLLLQHILENYEDVDQTLYASLDDLWFASHSLIDLVDWADRHGINRLYLDEVHRYKLWSETLKNIYDSYPDMRIVYTSSSLLALDNGKVDLSRRQTPYTLFGLSFREFLEFENVYRMTPLDVDVLLHDHVKLAMEITKKVKIAPLFETYLQHGYYPFYREEGDGFFDRLQQVIETIVTSEIPSVSNIEYDSVYKAKQLLAILAERTPYTLNISSLCNTMQSSRNNVLKLIDLMDKAALVRRLYSVDNGMNMLTKPEKILFYNTNLMYCLTPQVDSGTMRETYFASQIGLNHKMYMPNQGDLVVDGKWLFEVGGKGKGFSQIKDIQNSFVVSDDMEIGHGNKIPLWLFGLLY